ncbi:MAG: hypothetical protein HQM03_11870 [Magnetococcales bacterium]|nr:hypothetical protein [Magnetococcales bacterium]
MRLKMPALALLIVTLADPALAAPAKDAPGYDPKAACERYAQEDGIKPQHMDDYLAQCLKDLSNERAADDDLEPDPPDEPPVIAAPPPGTPSPGKP